LRAERKRRETILWNEFNIPAKEFVNKGLVVGLWIHPWGEMLIGTKKGIKEMYDPFEVRRLSCDWQCELEKLGIV